MDSTDCQYPEFTEFTSYSGGDGSSLKRIDYDYVREAKNQGEFITQPVSQSWYNMDSGGITVSRKRRSVADEVGSPEVAKIAKTTDSIHGYANRELPFAISEQSTDSVVYTRSFGTVSFQPPTVHPNGTMPVPEISNTKSFYGYVNQPPPFAVSENSSDSVVYTRSFGTMSLQHSTVDQIDTMPVPEKVDSTEVPEFFNADSFAEHMSVISTSVTSEDSNDCIEFTRSSRTVLPQPATADVSDPALPLQRRRNQNLAEKLTRKRSVNRSKWKSVARKTALNRGLQCLSSNEKKIVPAKKIGETCGPGCRSKCEEKMNEASRTDIFTQFWNLGDHTRQWDFIARHVIICGQKPDGQSSTRSHIARKYYFRVGGEDIYVCKTMFSQTLAISYGFIDTAIKKNMATEGIQSDKRGKNSRPPLALNPDVKQSVIEHINLFPRVESHYIRKDSKREYLEENLSIPQMHKLYLEWGKDKYPILANVRQYRDFFNNEFNIGFFKPKKDQCEVCTEYNNSGEEKKKGLQNAFEEHLLNKTKARELKANDAVRAKMKENTHVSMCCFDLQKVLQTPQGKSSLFYYRRKHSVYNFTIYDVGRHEGYCYVWTENEGNKGSNEVASFLLHYIAMKSNLGVREFVFYSDNCAGQNRNRFLFSMYVLAAQKYSVKVTHRFLEKGHTQNEGDSVHACIERRGAGREIYTPAQWYEIIRAAKKTKPYVVIEVEPDMIFDFRELVQNQNWLTDTDKNRVFWSKVKDLCTDGTSGIANVLMFKNNFEAAYRSINIDRNGRPINLKTYRLNRVFSGKLGIPIPKLKDLMFLCSKNAIPPPFHAYYRSLFPKPDKSRKGRGTRKAARSNQTYTDQDSDSM